MIRICSENDAERLYYIINEAAKAYRNNIPADCYHEPYMSREELAREMRDMTFFTWGEKGKLVAVMGFQPIKDVTLIRHAYVLPQWQGKGIGVKLMENMKRLCNTPRLLVGTWADASWAISFYVKCGFQPAPDKDELLRTYWKIPERQIETSVVLELK